MSNKKPSLFRRVLKFLAVVFILGIMMVLGAVVWALWPQSVITPESWKTLSPHGAVLLKLDPADGETGELIRDLARLGGEPSAEWAAWFATRAIHPEVTFLSFYDRSTGDEDFSMALQLRRLGNVFSTVLHFAAKDSSSDIESIGDGGYRVDPKHITQDEPHTHLMKQGVVVASGESIAARVGRFLRTGDASGAPRATDRMRELFGRMIVETGQLRGFFANDEGRIERLIERAEQEPDFPVEARDVFTPEVRQVLDDEFDGVLLAGELQPGDKLDLRVRLIFTSREAADAIEPVVRGYVVPQLVAEYGEAATFKVEREARVVTVTATVSDIREKLRQLD